MFKLLIFVLGVFLMAESSCQRIILPTYRPLPRKPVIIRAIRAADDEPLWLYKDDNINRAPSTADHPILPNIMDDVKLDPNRRYARSLDSPSAKRGGGTHSTSSGSRDTGFTHPGHNRRNARNIRLPELPTVRPFFPKPTYPLLDSRPFPIYARVSRDIQLGKKPSHRDVIIPNWNPNVRTNPWDRFGGKNRRN